MYVNQNPLCHHNRIVHKHAECYDQRTKGYSLEIDMINIHENKCGTDREKQNDADEKSAAKSHENHQHTDDDGQGLCQVQNKTVYRFFHAFGLIRHNPQFHANGTVCIKFVKAFADGFSHLHDVPS